MKKTFYLGLALAASFMLFFIAGNQVSYSQALNEGFNTVTFPPTGWTQTAGLWAYNAVSGFCSGTGSAKANFYGVSSGTFDLTSPSFTATGAGDSLIFQDAYASYSGEDDQLQVMYSLNGGTSYTQLALLHGGSAGELVTAPPQTSVFTPACAQWKYQRLALPIGTNKIRFNGISAFGNNLYIDSIYVKNAPVPPPVPTLLLPPNHSIGLPLVDTLTWSAASGATSYRLQLATDSLFTSIVLNSTFTGTAVIVSGFPTLFTCWWRVASIGPGGQSAFPVPHVFKTKGPSTTPVLLLPTNNAVNQPVSLTCIWQKAQDQTLMKVGISAHEITNEPALIQRSGKVQHDNSLVVSNYWFELYTDTTTAPVIRDSTLTDTTRAINGLLNNQNYWWRVKGKNDVPVWGAFSGYFKFTTVVAVPPPPTLISPANNSTGINLTPKLDWSVSAGATSYRVQLSSDSTFATTQLDSIISVDSINVPAGRLNNNVRYYWHVRAQNAGGSSAYTALFNFTTSLTGINSLGGVPKTFKLYDAYPNPFNPTSTIKFDIPKSADVKLVIFDMLGQEVSTLVNSKYDAGSYSVQWDAANFASGVYFYRITAGSFTDLHKMVLIK